MVVKGIHDLIRETNETIDIINGSPDLRIQQPDRTAERRTVALGGEPAASLADVMENADHSFVLY